MRKTTSHHEKTLNVQVFDNELDAVTEIRITSLNLKLIRTEEHTYILLNDQTVAIYILTKLKFIEPTYGLVDELNLSNRFNKNKKFYIKFKNVQNVIIRILEEEYKQWQN